MTRRPVFYGQTFGKLYGLLGQPERYPRTTNRMIT